MKSLALSLAVFALIPAPAWAQGGSGVKGGDAVVCFEPKVLTGELGQVIPYVEGQTLTEEGLKHAVRAYSREQYQIERLGKKSPFWSQIEHSPYDRALSDMIARFDEFPLYAKKLRDIDEKIGAWFDGAGFERIPDTGDSGASTFEPEAGCKFVQAVGRHIDQFRYVKKVEEMLNDGRKRATMQLHEISYYYAADLVGTATDSSSVELLILSAVGQDHSVERMGEKFREYGFVQTFSRQQLLERVRTNEQTTNEYITSLITNASREKADCPNSEFMGANFQGFGVLGSVAFGFSPPASGVAAVPDPIPTNPEFPVAGVSTKMPMPKFTYALANWIPNAETHSLSGLTASTLLPKAVLQASLMVDSTIASIGLENGYRFTILEAEPIATDAPFTGLLPPLTNISPGKCIYSGKPLTKVQRDRIESAFRALRNSLQ